MVERFKKTFDNHMQELLKVLTQSKRYETHIANLAVRLDYNYFYNLNVLNEQAWFELYLEEIWDEIWIKSQS
jgi:hypothetical protein